MSDKLDSQALLNIRQSLKLLVDQFPDELETHQALLHLKLSQALRQVEKLLRTCDDD